MTNDIQLLLAGLRADFLAELPERLDEIERLVLSYEQTTGSKEEFDDLFRQVHRLKGSGGTHGLHILSTICHSFEDNLNRAEKPAAQITKRWLDYVDLLRRAYALLQADSDDFSDIQAALDLLRTEEYGAELSVLLVVDSPSLRQLCQDVWADYPAVFVVADDGYQALGRLLHESFDVVLCSRQLPGLGGDALIAALKLSHAASATARTVLLTSSSSGCRVRNTDPDFVVQKDDKMVENLYAIAGQLAGGKRAG